MRGMTLSALCVVTFGAVVTLAQARRSPPCPEIQGRLITDRQVRQIHPLAEPQARVRFRDPVFGTCLVRVTDRKADVSPDDPTRGLKNEYSRVQAFNADESRILVRSVAASWHLYDAQTLKPLGQLPFSGSVDPRWDASDPEVLYYSDETRLKSCNVRTRAEKVVHDFAADFPGQTLAAVWSKYEGSPSIDGRYWGFMAEDENWETVAFLVYDSKSDRVIAKRDMRGVPGIAAVDNVYISPLGNYFLADFSDHYCERGQLGTDVKPCGYMVYDRRLTKGRGLLRISGHLDLALDAEGREAVVYQDLDADQISMVDLASGKVTPLLAIDFSHTAQGFHISGRAFRRPGWAVVSTYNGGRPASRTWMDDQVFAVELKRNGRVVRLAHTRSTYDEKQEQDYWAEPHASVNRDLTRIVFTSNWGRSGTGEVDMYLIELPKDWLKQLP